LGASKNLKQAQQSQFDIAKQQQQMGEEAYKQAQAAMGQREKLLQQPTQFATQIASGSPTAMMAAAAPQLRQIAQQGQQARGAIQDILPAGASRDFALAQSKIGQGAQTADFLNKSFIDALGTLQGIGSEYGQLGLQQMGAGFRGAEGAGSAYQQVAQTEAQRQAAKWNMLGSLAGMAGGALTSGLGAGLSKGMSSGFGKLFNAGGLFNKFAVGSAMNKLPLISGMPGLQGSSEYNQLNQGPTGGYGGWQ
jgi:hypothetical protein